MPVTQHSPHRSRRAALPHRAPASGDHGQAPGEACRTRARTCDREPPALRPAPGLRDHVPLGPRPALHRRRPSHGATGGRRLPRSSAAVRRPAPGPPGRLPEGAPCGPGQPAPGPMPGLPGAAPWVAGHARDRRPRPVCPPRALPGCPVWPSACAERVGPQESPACGAHDSAGTFPCPRFVFSVTASHTCRGASVVGSTCTGRDLPPSTHRRLFPAHPNAGAHLRLEAEAT